MTPRCRVATLGLVLTLFACGKYGPPVRTGEVPATDSAPSATSESPAGQSSGSPEGDRDKGNGDSEEERR